MSLQVCGNAKDGFFGIYTDDDFDEAHEKSDRLRPCPFCGTDTDLEIKNTHIAYYWVECNNCACSKNGRYPPGHKGGKILTKSRLMKYHLAARRIAVEGWNDRQGASVAGELAYQLTKALVIDMPTARAAVDQALKGTT